RCRGHDVRCAGRGRRSRHGGSGAPEPGPSGVGRSGGCRAGGRRRVDAGRVRRSCWSSRPRSRRRPAGAGRRVSACCVAAEPDRRRSAGCGGGDRGRACGCWLRPCRRPGHARPGGEPYWRGRRCGGAVAAQPSRAVADVVVGPSAADIVKERAAVARWDHRYRVLTVCVLAVLAVAILSAPAFGHASLVETVPAAGAALDTAPDTVVLRFNEPVSASTDGVRVYDADAERIDTGPIETGSSDEVAAGLPAQLPDGGYVVVYRVLSADSHPVGGTYAFTVGDGDAVAG